MTDTPQIFTFSPRFPSYANYPSHGRTLVILREPLRRFNRDGSLSLMLDTGFISDGRSILSFLSPVFGNRWDEPYFVPALFHDEECGRALKAHSYQMRCWADENYRDGIYSCDGTRAQAERDYHGVVLGRWALRARGLLR